MKKMVAFILGISVHMLATAEWKVDKHVDSMTDEERKMAIVKNEQGHSFSIYRLSKDGPVWGNFSLSQEMFDQVDWKKAPIFRIDQNKPNDLAGVKRLQDSFGVKAYEWEPKWVNFLIWHGKQDEGISDNIVNLMEGQKLVFRYYLSTGGYKDTEFSLNGAASAISEAIDINANIDHAAQEKSKDFIQAVSAETMKCRVNMSTFNTCFAHVTACSNQSEKDAAKFMACMQ
jgi:hypothetical protein